MPSPLTQRVAAGDVAFRVLDRLKHGTASFSGRVTVLDINAEMVAEGQKKAEASGRAGRHLRWLVDSAEKLPLPEASVDSYTVAFGIRNVTHRAAALAEAARVLRPGGRFLCLEFSPVEVPLLREAYDAYSMHIIPALGQMIAGDADSYRCFLPSLTLAVSDCPPFVVLRPTLLGSLGRCSTLGCFQRLCRAAERECW